MKQATIPSPSNVHLDVLALCRRQYSKNAERITKHKSSLQYRRFILYLVGWLCILPTLTTAWTVPTHNNQRSSRFPPTWYTEYHPTAKSFVDHYEYVCAKNDGVTYHS